MYSQKVIQHFTNPKNFGKMKNPDAVGKAGNPRCGDMMELYLKIDQKTKKIKDVKFHTLGCAAAIASSDMVCELIKGKTTKEALKLKPEDIVKELGEMPAIKLHCSVLAIGALHQAIEQYEKSRKNKKYKSGGGDVPEAIPPSAGCYGAGWRN